MQGRSNSLLLFSLRTPDSKILALKSDAWFIHTVWVIQAHECKRRWGLLSKVNFQRGDHLLEIISEEEPQCSRAFWRGPQPNLRKFSFYCIFKILWINKVCLCTKTTLKKGGGRWNNLKNIERAKEKTLYLQRCMHALRAASKQPQSMCVYHLGRCTY